MQQECDQIAMACRLDIAVALPATGSTERP